VIDSGTAKLGDEEFLATSRLLVDFFTTALAVPESEMWVNLSPDENNRMIGPSLAGTAMGRGFLEADLRLKRLAASLLHPDCAVGQEYWKEVARRSIASPAGDISTSQRVWVVPDKALVYAAPVDGHKHSAFLVEQHLGIRCENASLNARWRGDVAGAPETDEICTSVYKEIVLPVLDKEVNEGSQFAALRQIQHSLILATWMKKEFKDHPSWKARIDTGQPGDFSITRLEPTDLKKTFNIPDGPTNESEFATKTAEPGVKQIEAKGDHRELLLEEAVRLRDAGRNTESLRSLRELVAECREDSGIMTGVAQAAISQLGRTLRAMGQLEEAQALHAEVLRHRRYLLGDDHPRTVNSMTILAETLEMSGKTTAAQELRSEAQGRHGQAGAAFSIRENREFYEEYMRVFHRGVFNLTRTEYLYSSSISTKTSRNYFAGAIDFRFLGASIRQAWPPSGGTACRR
jgi:hypothetical protein